jgi:hypothetical protein
MVVTNYIGQKVNGQKSSLHRNVILALTVRVNKGSGLYTSLYLYN